MTQTLVSDFLIAIDRLVVDYEDQGIPFQDLLADLKEYCEICEDLDGE